METPLETQASWGHCVFYGLILNSLLCLVPPAWMLQVSCIMSWPVGSCADTIHRDGVVVRLGALAKAGAFHVHAGAL